MRWAAMLLTATMAACASYKGESPPEDGGALPDSGTPVDAAVVDSGDATTDAGRIDSGNTDIVDFATPCLGALDCVRVVFVSSSQGDGNQNGITGADTECQELADASTVAAVSGRKFRAWLSTNATSASGRLPHGTKPYGRPDGKRIADDWMSLISGTLKNPINVNESNQVVDTSEVWTGTEATGEPAAVQCNNWASGSNALAGTLGNATKTDSSWSNRGVAQTCEKAARIYCVED